MSEDTERALLLKATTLICLCPSGHPHDEDLSCFTECPDDEYCEPVALVSGALAAKDAEIERLNRELGRHLHPHEGACITGTCPACEDEHWRTRAEAAEQCAVTVEDDCSFGHPFCEELDGPRCRACRLAANLRALLTNTENN